MVDLIFAEGGRERSADEYEQLLDRAGLRQDRIHATDSPLRIIEAGKP